MQPASDLVLRNSHNRRRTIKGQIVDTVDLVGGAVFLLLVLLPFNYVMHFVDRYRMRKYPAIDPVCAEDECI